MYEIFKEHIMVQTREYLPLITIWIRVTQTLVTRGGEKLMATYNRAPKELVPELLLLGTMEREEIMLDDGSLLVADIIEFKKEKYVVNIVSKEQWYDGRSASDPPSNVGEEMCSFEGIEVLDPVKFWIQ